MGDDIELVQNFMVKEVIFNIGNYNKLEKKLIKVLNEKKIKYQRGAKYLDIKNNKLYFLNTC